MILAWCYPLPRSFDELCKQAVELGHTRLGFSRMGLWFRDEQSPDMMIGSFGIDEQGKIRDERNIHLPLSPGAFSDMLQENASIRIWEDAPLYNHKGEVIGNGWIAAATLWDGDNVIGWLSMLICTIQTSSPHLSKRIFYAYTVLRLVIFVVKNGHYSL